MASFPTHNNAFDRIFKFSLGDRYATTRVALNLLSQLDSHSIVETGCMRTLDSIMEGNSTRIWGYFVRQYGGHVTTIDISDENMAICRQATEKYASHIDYIVGDSVEVLSKGIGRIDLLYLDSMDCPISGDASRAQEHQLTELKTAHRWLHDRSIVLLDDSAFANGGKTFLSKQWLEDNEWMCVLEMYQSLWIKKPNAIF
jgi:Cephalosporin hydroxylase.